MFLRWTLFLTIVVVAVGCGLLLHRRKRRRVRAGRAELFRDVAGLFTDVYVTQDDVDFPVLTGYRDAHRWRLEPVVDAVTYRKLPTLWLCVTCYADRDLPAPVSVLMRPTGNEFFSPNAKYPHDLPLPDECPPHARAASTNSAGDVSVLGATARLLEERETKEVWASARGVRVVRQVSEADSGRYRIGRRVDLGGPVLDADDLRRVSEVVAASVRDFREVTA